MTLQRQLFFSAYSKMRVGDDHSRLPTFKARTLNAQATMSIVKRLQSSTTEKTEMMVQNVFKKSKRVLKRCSGSCNQILNTRKILICNILLSYLGYHLFFVSRSMRDANVYRQNLFRTKDGSSSKTLSCR